MSIKLSLEIEELRDDEPVSVSAYDNRWQALGRALPEDSGPPGGRDDPDDPGPPGGRDDPDDPGPPGGRDDPDDPGPPGGRDDPDDPRGFPRRLVLESGPHDVRIRSTQASVSAPVIHPRYSGSIIVRMSPLLPHGKADDLGQFAEKLHLEGLKTVLTRFGTPASAPAVKRDPPSASEKLAPEIRAPRKSALKKGARKEDCPRQDDKRVSLETLELRTAGRPLGPPNSLRRYWRVEGPTTALTPPLKEAFPENGLGYSMSELAQAFVDQLNGLQEIDLAYRELAASDPDMHTMEASGEDLSDFQLYMDPSPLGLDARWARCYVKRPDGNGSEGNRPEANRPDDKIFVADLEQGWIPHEDFDGGVSLRPVHGDNRHGTGPETEQYQGHHGTAVLSELAGSENSVGIVGMAAGAGQAVVASHYRRSTGRTRLSSNGHVADAIKALITGNDPRLKAGDILLLEVERGGLPTEVDPLDFDAIRLAVANGIIVVEAAGNGGVNLDRLPTTEDGRSFNRRHANFQDSGAIMVGAARAAMPHNRASFSNYGSRVDCFGWGNSVVAAGYGDYLGGDDTMMNYTDIFAGTSAASPMIAAAALLVQNLYRANAAPPTATLDESWKRLSPRQMRALLSDPRTGTPQGPGVPGHIGVMPDLRAILDEALGIVPRIYLRNHVNDIGETPRGQQTCTSPDIIVANGSARAGKFEGVASENDSRIGLGLSPSGGRRLFVRMRNRGILPAEDTKVTVYAAEVSTLVAPDRWKTEVGTTEPLSVPQGDTLTVRRVVPKVSLKKIEVGKEKGCIENFCLVAVAEHKHGPEPPVPCPAFHLNWQKYLSTMRKQANVAIRNVHQLHTGECEFKVNGTADAPRVFEFEVIQRLPSGMHVDLTAQLGLALKFSRRRLWSVTRNGDKATLHLPRLPRFRLGRMTLPAGIDFPCSFQVVGGKLAPGHSFAIRQLYRGQEVGRITWRA